MKTIGMYFYAVILLGSFSGLLISMGQDIMPCICFMCLFWAGMLMPMLGAD
jgi:hypothetical protein